MAVSIAKNARIESSALSDSFRRSQQNELSAAILFPGRFIVRGSAIVVEASTEVSEERGEFLGARDAEMDEGQCRFVFVCRHRV